jgi:polysaccharide export outer membrane protein
MIINFKYLAFILLVLFSFSCSNHKEALLLNHGDLVKDVNLHENFDIKIEKNDYLQILLISKDKEANELFTTKFENSQGLVTYSSGVPSKGGFLVDDKGNVSIPFIGEIKVAGLYRQQIIQEIQTKLEEYVKDPYVQVNLLNFKITVVGEVNNPGTFNIPNERINIFQALSLSGDLTNFSNRSQVHLVREIDQERKEYILDMTSKDIFNSEVFFLKQNDIIYVPQKKSKSVITFNQFVLPFVSVTSLILTAINLIIN